MTSWIRPQYVVPAALGIVAYFAAALTLKYSWVGSPKPPGEIVRLNRPFYQLEGRPFAFGAQAPQFERLADTVGAPTRSPFMLFENDRPLGPAHSLHAEIGNSGAGRFS